MDPSANNRNHRFDQAPESSQDLTNGNVVPNGDASTDSDNQLPLDMHLNGNREVSSREVGGARPKVTSFTRSTSQSQPTETSTSSNSIRSSSSRRDRDQELSQSSSSNNFDDFNDDYIYTYKGDLGDHNCVIADLPKSLLGEIDVIGGSGQSNLSIEMAALIQSEMASNAEGHQVAPSSPVLEFLEMDFDAGQSDDEESVHENNGAVGGAAVENGHIFQFEFPSQSPNDRREKSQTPEELSHEEDTEPGESLNVSVSSSSCSGGGSENGDSPEVMLDEVLESEVCRRRKYYPEEVSVPKDQTTQSKISRTEENHGVIPRVYVDDADSNVASTARTMVWSELEACKHQQTCQTGSFNSGTVAAVNVLHAFGYTDVLEKVDTILQPLVRHGSRTSLLPDFLFSRSISGPIHTDLIYAVKITADRSIFGRFFPMYPMRRVNVVNWLAEWIRKGAIPVVTRKGVKGPACWHHQMVFGIADDNVYLMNPIERLPLSLIGDQLCSPSTLEVSKRDVLFHWDPDCHLHKIQDLAYVHDERWDTMNVLGQVVNMLREDGSHSPHRDLKLQAQHISIPVRFRSGITLFLPEISHHAEELKHAPDFSLSFS